ncbi:MAG TPA: hypothetical protein VHV57_16590 [Acidimicrobiales bacterium]|jgi:hypothetical protein|nr:hypothetical protein [Acidimicrobiales bacterium]
MPEELHDLEPFIGQWRMVPRFDLNADAAPRALASFEWLPGKRFLVQRWEVEHPEAPDGIAIIGFYNAEGTYLQHYFDSRGVARVYEMSFADNVWTLQRIAGDPDFSRRFIGRFGADGRSIVGSWESSNDLGSNWTLDFELTYTKVE